MKRNLRALITGSSSGIGMAYAKYLASQGWYLDLISKDPSRSKEAEKILNYPRANSFLADLSQPSEVEHLLTQTTAPDLIIANAGITRHGKAGMMPKQDKADLFYLLCNGVIDLIEGFLDEMKKKDSARIIIISSIAAITPMPKSSIYASAKSAIYSYGQSLSEELKEDGISVTVSLPGYVKTDIHKKAGLDHLRKNIPSWMWIEPHQAVRETENASLKGQTRIIPGLVYRIVSPFLRSSLCLKIWKRLTKKR